MKLVGRWGWVIWDSCFAVEETGSGRLTYVPKVTQLPGGRLSPGWNPGSRITYSLVPPLPVSVHLSCSLLGARPSIRCPCE